MIDHLDRMIERVLLNAGTVTKVSFNAPTEAWRGSLDPNDGITVSAYLADLHEKRDMRHSGDTTRTNGHFGTRQGQPTHVECHYLLSAWSAAADPVPRQSLLEEHATLWEVARALTAASPFNAARIAPGQIPQEIRDRDLPTEVLPPEGFHKLAEFWSGMGAGAIWRPVVYLVVTLPMEPRPESAGRLVTTVFTRWSPSTSEGAPVETWVQIAGRVLDSGRAVERARVRLERAGERIQSATTDADGRFDFVGLTEGADYDLVAGANGLPTGSRPVHVPEPSGVYDLDLTQP